jgi:GNAT superfamily N-acetyltransferase
VSIRLAQPDDAPAIGRVHVETWRAAYRSLVPEAYLASLSAVGRAAEWRELLAHQDHKRFVLAATSERREVVGFAAAGPERAGEPGYDGELYALYLLPAHQGQGLGRALVRDVASRLAAAGMQSMLLWVFEANSAARRFYEKLGGTYLRQQPMTLGGASFDEVAYGWKPLDRLLPQG